MKLCERHSRLRCGECAYIEELKQDNQDLADKYNRDVYALEAKVEEMQKTLEWAARIIDSGMGAGILRYDPLQWFIDYHTFLKGGENK